MVVAQTFDVMLQNTIPYFPSEINHSENKEFYFESSPTKFGLNATF